MTHISENILLKGGTLADGSVKDVLIADGVIHSVGDSLNPGDARIVSAEGHIVLSGLVDLHTHVREPGREDSETVLSGSQAGVKGGYVALSAMANTSPVADTAGVVEQVYRLGKEAGLLDVFPIGAVTQGIEGKVLAEIGAMADSLAHVRVFSDDGNCVSDPLVMRRALEYV
jgi:dihydroorotase